jgi:hypothetical protein
MMVAEIQDALKIHAHSAYVLPVAVGPGSRLRWQFSVQEPGMSVFFSVRKLAVPEAVAAMQKVLERQDEDSGEEDVASQDDTSEKEQLQFKFPAIDEPQAGEEYDDVQKQTKRARSRVFGITFDKEVTSLIHSVERGYAAHALGIRAGDRVLEINGSDINTLLMNNAMQIQSTDLEGLGSPVGSPSSTPRAAAVTLPVITLDPSRSTAIVGCAESIEDKEAQEQIVALKRENEKVKEYLKGGWKKGLKGESGGAGADLDIGIGSCWEERVRKVFASIDRSQPCIFTVERYAGRRPKELAGSGPMKRAEAAGTVEAKAASVVTDLKDEELGQEVAPEPPSPGAGALDYSR